MTEVLPIEAVRAVASATDPARAAGSVPPVADPAAVAKFEAAMAAEAPSAVPAVDPIPFADAASAAWRTTQVNHQGILRRVRALSALGTVHTPAAAELVELQYEVANLAFQQEVVTKVADKTSSAIQTLIKNQ